MNRINRFFFIGAVLLCIASYDTHAQTKKVEYITISAVNADTIISHLNTYKLYYSNGRGGIAKPMKIAAQEYTLQSLYYDSMISLSTVNYSRDYYKTYYQNNSVESYSIYKKSGVLVEKYSYTYNSNNAITSIISLSNSTLATKDTFIYNNGKITDQISYKYDVVNNTWISDRRIEYKYNSAKLVEEQLHLWDAGLNAYKIASKTNYYYTSNSLDSMCQYVYESHSIKVINGLYSWVSADKVHKTFYSYSSGRYDSVKAELYHDTIALKLDRRQLQTFQYNNNNDIKEIETLFWDTSGKKWNKSSKEKNTYNSHNNNDSVFYSRWQASGKIYTDVDTVLNYYNNNHFHYQTSRRWWNGSSLNDTVAIYHYDTLAQPTSIELQCITGDIQVYPNPASSLINININIVTQDNLILRVYDIGGVLRQQIEIKANESNVHLPTSSLANGIYILELSGNGYRAIEKVTIAR